MKNRWLIEAPVLENLLQDGVMRSIETNAEFHSKAGMKPKIVRKTDGKCCEWCSKIAGTYTYPDGVPPDVYRRHKNCTCTVEYYPGDGKKQDVWSKKWSEDSEELEKRKTIGLDETSKEELEQRKTVGLGKDKYKVTCEKHVFSDGTANSKRSEENAIVYTTPEGTRFIFQESLDTNLQTMTPKQAISCWQQVPLQLRQKIQNEIEIVDYENPEDDYWRQRYKNFERSYAIGGDKITFFRYAKPHDMDYLIRTYCHEGGHYIDEQNLLYSLGFDWTNAMKDDMITSGMKSITEYGENSPAEDFAESVVEYVKDKAHFLKLMPKRGELLQKLLGF